MLCKNFTSNKKLTIEKAAAEYSMDNQLSNNY